MRPLLLEIEGLRSFRSKTTIDFTDVGLFAIVGDTGAGKSSILEAITYALYNASTWSQSNPKELICSDCEQMSVTFTFALGDKQYKLMRKTARGNYPPPTHLLEGPGLRADGEKDVREDVRRLLGLEWGTFIKTMVLPQGKFSDLLTSTPGERTKILREILALDELKGLKDLLEPYKGKARDLLTRLRTLREAMPKEPRAELELAKQQAAEASENASRVEAAHADVIKVRATIDLVGRSQQEADRIGRTLKPLTDTGTNLDGISARADELLARRKTTEKALSEAKAEAEASEKALAELTRQRCDKAAIAKARDAVERFRESRNRWTQVQQELDSDNKQLNNDRKSLQKLCNELPKLEADVARLEKTEAGAAEQYETESNREATAQSLLKTLKDAEQSVKTAEAKSIAASKVLEKAQIAEAEAASNLASRMKSFEEDEKALGSAQKANAAAELCHDLHAGDNCPICKRTLPNTFVPIRSTSLRQLKRKVETAKAALEEDREQHVDARSALASAKTDEKSCRQEATATQKRLESCKTELAAIGVVVARHGLSALKERVKLARAAVQSAKADLAAARDEFARKKTASDGEGRRVEQFAKGIEAKGKDLATEKKRVEKELAAIPEGYRPQLASGDSEIKKCERELEKAEAKAIEIESVRNDSLERVNDQLMSLSAISNEYKDLVELPLQAARLALRTQYEALGEAQEFLEATWRVPDSPATEELALIRQWCRDLVTTQGKATLSLAEISARNKSVLDEAQKSISKVLSSVGLASEAELYEVQVETVAAARRFHERVSELEAIVVQALELDKRLENVEPFSSALDVLHSMLGDGSFIRYVVEKRELRLLSIASEIFGRMTGERYGFAVGAKIVDKESGQERSAKTLSGGETFLASLALSLALVEIAVRAGGKLEALFLDEGFGSLDTVALDEAMQELERQASDGKTIGVITHIRGVTDYIDTILRVDRTSQGSTVRRVEDVDAEALIREAQLEGLLSQH